MARARLRSRREGRDQHCTDGRTLRMQNSARYSPCCCCTCVGTLAPTAHPRQPDDKETWTPLALLRSLPPPLVEQTYRWCTAGSATRAGLFEGQGLQRWPRLPMLVLTLAAHPPRWRRTASHRRSLERQVATLSLSQRQTLTAGCMGCWTRSELRWSTSAASSARSAQHTTASAQGMRGPPCASSWPCGSFGRAEAPRAPFSCNASSRSSLQMPALAPASAAS